MNAILRCIIVLSSFAIATTFLTGLLVAAPLQIQVNMTAGPESPSHPLAGAALQLNFFWDAAASPPLNSNAQSTLWGLGDSVGSLTVIGSAASDGVYKADFSPSPILSWYVTNDLPPLGDTLRFPDLSFKIGGDTIRTGILQAILPSSYFNAPHPFLPKPFDSSEATWNTLPFSSGGLFQDLIATVDSGFAVVVPEPSTIALGSVSLLSLFGLRRAQKERRQSP